MKNNKSIFVTIGVAVLFVVLVAFTIKAGIQNKNNSKTEDTVALLEAASNVKEAVSEGIVERDTESTADNVESTETTTEGTAESTTESTESVVESIEETASAYDVLNDFPDDYETNDTFSIDEVQAELMFEEDIKIVNYNDRVIENGKELKMTCINTYESSMECVKTVAVYVPDFGKDFWTNKITHIAFSTKGDLVCNIDFIAKVTDDYPENYKDKLEYLGFTQIKDNMFSMKEGDTVIYTYINYMDGVFGTYSIECNTSLINEYTEEEMNILRAYLEEAEEVVQE